MGPRREDPDWLATGRRVWRTIAPARLRGLAQPIVLGVMERRVRNLLRRGEPAPARGPLIVSGLLSEAKGVSEGARLSLAALRDAGFSPVAHDLRPAFEGADTALPVARDGGVWFLHVNAPEAIQALGRTPAELWRGRYRIGYWAYELPRVPQSWVRMASAFHEIWTPSDFVSGALRDSGVTTPIRTMPHPVATGDGAGAADHETTSSPSDGFSVLAMGDLKSSAARKNLTGAIDIYRRAFASPERARLIVKVREAGAHPAFLARAREMSAGRPDITFVTDDLTSTDVRRLIASCSLLLSPHRSEGFGLPLAEAFLAGVPALATGWSGNLAFMRDVPELLIATSLVPVRDPYGVYRARNLLWAEPDIADAASKLARLADDAALRERLARRGKEAVKGLSGAWSRQALLETAIGSLSESP